MAVLITATGPTVLRTYVFPDANATMLTTNAAVTPAQGGTGLATYTVGDLIYASGTTTLAKLADVATGQLLTSGGVGVAPAWSASPTISGSFIATGDITASGTAVTAPLNGFFQWPTRTLLASPANGQLIIENQAGSAGVGFDVATDATLKVRTRALTTDASVTALNLTASGAIAASGANGQSFGAVQQLTELTTIAAAATTDTTIQMPAGAVVLAVSVRVTVVIPTAATFTVGDSGSAARFSTAAVAVAANSTDPGTKAGAYYNAGALSVRITPNLTPGANSGRVRTTIYYYSVTPPTS